MVDCPASCHLSPNCLSVHFIFAVDDDQACWNSVKSEVDDGRMQTKDEVPLTEEELDNVSDVWVAGLGEGKDVWVIAGDTTGDELLENDDVAVRVLFPVTATV